MSKAKQKEYIIISLNPGVLSTFHAACHTHYRKSWKTTGADPTSRTGQGSRKSNRKETASTSEWRSEPELRDGKEATERG